MADGGKMSTQAERLAAWTTLSPDRFGDIYASVADPGAAPRWSVISANLFNEKPDALEAEVVQRACRIAEEQGFLLRLAQAVVRVECENDRRERSEGGTLLRALGSDGEMQAINNRVRGLNDTRVFQVLHEACGAIAIVYADGVQVGTALLVRPDLVMTAAHVVLTHEEAGWRDRLRSNLVFSFQPLPNDTLRQRVPIPAATTDALVAHALPHGVPPDRLTACLKSPANDHLDFAMVRLAREVRHVRVLELDPAVDPKLGNDCFVIGFPGGTALKYGSDPIEKLEMEAGRLVHQANTFYGMSGGGCFNQEGRLVGLHEGSLPRLLESGKREKNRYGDELSDNRGVLLSAIRAMTRRAPSDPLTARRKVPGIEFSDPALVERMYWAGARLVSPVWRNNWSVNVETVLDCAPYPGGKQPAPRFHPWLQRKPVEDWFDTSRPNDRLLYLNGPSGCGKSFCIDILRGKLEGVGGQHTDLVSLTATQTSAWSWEDAISRFTTDLDRGARTTPGAIRYDDVPTLVSLLADYRGRSTDPNRPLYVAIDFDAAPEDVRIEAAPWRTFIEAMAREDWIRILVIGLGEDERREINDLLYSNPLTEKITPNEVALPHLSEVDLVRYAQQLFKSRARNIDGPSLRASIAEMWRHERFSLHVTDAQMQSVEVALAAMMLERGLADGQG